MSADRATARQVGNYGALLIIGIVCLLVLTVVLLWANFDVIYSGLLREQAPVVPPYPNQVQVETKVEHQDDKTTKQVVFRTSDSPERVLEFYNTRIGPPARWVSQSGSNPRLWEYDPDYCPWSTLKVTATAEPSGLTAVQVDLRETSCRP